MKKNAAIFGATSAICHAVAQNLAQQGYGLYLLARDADKLAAVADDIDARGGEVLGQKSYDFVDHSETKALFESLLAMPQSLDAILIGHGALPSQLDCEQDAAKLVGCLRSNLESTAVIMNYSANLLAAQKSGSLAVISSVAGDRGRKSNYCYGATKSALNVMLEGMRGRLREHGVSVINIKPGMVDTPMTAHLPRSPLLVDKQKVALDISQAIATGKSTTIYAPWFWRYIMLVIRVLPPAIMARLKF
ncbi:MAG: SDR family NAD(P)-dependent oxidoreductase [Pseudomonadales bacterium]